MVNKTDVAVQKYLSGFNCSQAVLFACADDIGIDKDTALKIASGFGAGMGRKQETCGAVTGGIIAIGAKYGRGENDEHSAIDNTYIKTRELIDNFTTKYGTHSCLELLNGCKLTTDAGRKFYQENDLKNKICKGYVASAVTILNDIL